MNPVHLSIDQLMPAAIEQLGPEQRVHLEACPSCWYDAQVLAEVYMEEGLADTLIADLGTASARLLSDPALGTQSEGGGIDTIPQSMVSLLPGSESMMDNLQIQKWVGNGLTGPVYKVFDPDEGNVLAAKVLRNASRKSQDRIKREFSTYRQLDHSVVVSPQFIDDTGDALVVYSGWVIGQSYDSWLGLGTLDLLRNPASPRQIGQVMSVLLDVGSALFSLHEQGLVHGHMAPAKILVTESGRAQLLEPGLWTGVTQDGRLDPWRDYLAPESVASGTRSSASDWFAFGELVNLAARTMETAPQFRELGLSLTMTSPEVREHGSKVLWALVEMIGPGLLSRDENRYVDLGLLGQGGMGEVRRAHDPDLRRSVALKSVREDLSQNEDLNSRFKAEAQIMAQLQHPGIVPVYEIARLADGRHYFSMQEIEGETLGSVLQRLRAHSGPREWATVPSQNGGRDWSFQRMVASVERVCDAMAYAHDRQVIHRDLKPENIMLGAYGEVFVIDWGLAKILGQGNDDEMRSVDTTRSENAATETGHGWIGGTPAYMSPEQAWGKSDEMDHRSDIYSIGAILYHLLTGEPPYQDESAALVIRQVRNAPPPILRSPRNERQELADENTRIIWQPNSETLINICEKAMAREPVNRFHSARTLSAELAAWHEGAKQREAGLAAYEQAQDEQVKELAERQLANELHGQCEAEVQANALDDTSAWETHQDALAARRSAEDRRFEYAQRLQVALAHSSTLVEAHKSLAVFHYEAGLSAITDLNERALRQAKRLVNAHLSHLPYDGEWRLKLTAWLDFAQLNPGTADKASTPFVGRKALLKHCREHCETMGQLISLVGTSGCGKSRLIDEFASQAQDIFTGGIYPCDLALVSQPDEIVQRVGEALGISLTQGDPIERISLALHARGRVALILDDVDHLDQYGLDVCGVWLSNAPHLTVFTTGTRKGITADCVEIDVPPLSLLKAMELFEAAARNIRPSFKLTRGNWVQIKTITNFVDGLPLAVELAASRIGILSLQDLEKRLRQGLSVLGETDALSHALEWSWRLLNPTAQRTLMKTSVFRGGFDLDAAEAIMRGEMDDPHESVLDVLASLRHDNLIRTVAREGYPTRYFIYASIRTFAMEKLKVTGPGDAPYQQVIDQIAAHYAHLGSNDALDTLDGIEAQDRRRHLGLEFENLRLSSVRATSLADATNCAFAACAVLDFQGPLSAGARLLEELLSRADVSDYQRMRLAPLMSRFQEQDNTRVMRLQLLSEALTTAREWNSARFEGILLRSMGTLHHQEGNTAEAETHYQLALTAHTEAGDERLTAITLSHLSRLSLQRGMLEEAETQVIEALALCQRVGDQRHTALCHLNMGRLASHKGDWVKARTCLESALGIYRHIGYRRFQAQTLNTLANLSMDTGEIEHAKVYYEEAVTLHQRSGSQGAAAIVQGNLGELYLRLNQYQPAIDALTFAVTVCDRTYPSAGAQFKGPLGLALAMLDKFEEAHRLCAAGQRFLEEGDQKLALGKHFCFGGLVYARANDMTNAKRMHEMAAAVFDKVQPGKQSQFGQLLDQLAEVFKS